MKAYIKGIATFLPERVLTNEELVKEFPEWSVEKVASKIGIYQRHIAGKYETACDMAIQAALNLFEQNPNIRKEDIDYVLFCTQSPDYYLPTSACLVQKQLGLRKDIGALDFNLGCSGYVYGLSLAKGLICGNIAKNILLLTAETYSKYLHPKDKGNRTIFGDGASATLISNEGVAEIGNFSLGTDGAGAENLIVRTGCSRQKMRADDLVFDEGNNPASSDYLYMNGSEIFNFTLEAVPILVKDTIIRNCLEFEDINLFVFHQANKYIMNFMRKKIKIEESKFYYCLENVGNTVSSTIPIALCQAWQEGRLHGNILLAGFGVGYSWGGVILKYNL
ncbi:3-oxoacyl-ACP synthase III family protein [Parabacteroides sp.]